MSIPAELLIILRCPDTGERLAERDADHLVSESGRSFPVVDDVPVLLSDYWTPFDATAVAQMESSGFSPRAVRAIARWLPPLDKDMGGEEAFDEFFRAALKGGHCLVIGAGDSPVTNRRLREHFARVTTTDIVKGPDTAVVCDAHSIPFADDSFDAAVVVAVLEHVISPERVVAEITRVLKKGGIVYAATAFMQQVHMGRFDFTRFTDLGHRWLFRCYDEIIRTNAGGPASALAWSLTYLALSFVSTRKAVRLATRAVMRLLFFWVHWLDYLVRRRLPARDAASGVIFVGRNEKAPVVSPRQLVAQYHGGF
jgi:SAM-dependent methyltransferase